MSAPIVSRKPEQSDGAEDAFRVPDHIEQYRIVRPLGRGSMGHVFLGHDIELDRPVAVKFIAAGEPGAAARRRFQVEARAIARVRHANVVEIYCSGSWEGRPFLISEFVRGVSLAALKKPLLYAHALRIAVELARGLGEAHERGVLHRDIKPANAIDGEDGHVKLLDFGLAKLTDGLSTEPDAPPRTTGVSFDVDQTPPLKGQAPGAAPAPTGCEMTAPPLTQTGAVLGTPLYLAPEVFLQEAAATARSDVYSLGAVIYELCTGRPPHAAGTQGELEQALRHDSVRPLHELAPDCDSRFTTIVDRCLQRAPGARYSSGLELRQALEVLLDVAPRRSRIAPPWSTPSRLAVVGATVLLGSAAGALLLKPAPAGRSIPPSQIVPAASQALPSQTIRLAGVTASQGASVTAHPPRPAAAQPAPPEGPPAPARASSGVARRGRAPQPAIESLGERDQPAAPRPPDAPDAGMAPTAAPPATPASGSSANSRAPLEPSNVRGEGARKKGDINDVEAVY